LEAVGREAPQDTDANSITNPSEREIEVKEAKEGEGLR
jgi:hypothetical protein